MSFQKPQKAPSPHIAGAPPCRPSAVARSPPKLAPCPEERVPASQEASCGQQQQEASQQVLVAKKYSRKNQAGIAMEVSVASLGVTRRVQLPANTTVAALRAVLSQQYGAAVRLVHMGRLLEDSDRRPLGEWYCDADVLRVVGSPAKVVSAEVEGNLMANGKAGTPRPIGSVRIVAPPCGPEAGGTRVHVQGTGFCPHRAWALRFGSTVVPADVVRETDGHIERWGLCCLAPAHSPGVVTVDAMCDGELRNDKHNASYTYLSRQQWKQLVEQVAAPSHARNCMQTLGDGRVAAAAGNTPRWST